MSLSKQEAVNIEAHIAISCKLCGKCTPNQWFIIDACKHLACGSCLDRTEVKPDQNRRCPQCDKVFFICHLVDPKIHVLAMVVVEGKEVKGGNK